MERDETSRGQVEKRRANHRYVHCHTNQVKTINSSLSDLIKKLSHQSFVKNAQQTSTSLRIISHQQPTIMNPLSNNAQLDDCRGFSNRQFTSTANPIFSSLSIDNSHAQRPRSASSDSSDRYKKISRTIDTIDAVLDLVDMDDFGDFDLTPSCTTVSSHQWRTSRGWCRPRPFTTLIQWCMSTGCFKSTLVLHQTFWAS